VALHLHSITFDAAEPGKLADFWAGMTGYTVEMANEFVAILTGGGSVGPRLMFLKVPEGKMDEPRIALRRLTCEDR
jgi:hypothetical protein